MLEALGIFPLLLDGGRISGPRMLRAWCAYGAITAALFAPWVVKNTVLVGNPVFPFLSTIFFNDSLVPQDYRNWLRLLKDWSGYEGTWWDLLRSPWLLTWKGDVFGGSPGPVFLFFFPLAALLGWRNKILRPWILWTLAGYGFQILGTKQVRFFVPLFPLASVIIAGALLSWRPAGRFGLAPALRGLALLILVALVLLQLPYFTHLWQQQGTLTLRSEEVRLFTSVEERTRFLEARLLGKETLATYRFLNQALPSGAKVLSLTEAYQSLLDAPLYVAPNCSPANHLSRQVMGAGLSAAHLSTVRLHVESKARHRYWIIRFPENPVLPAVPFLRPRVFRLQEGYSVELNVLGVKRNDRAGVEVTLDLGLARQVDRIEYWSRPQSQPVSVPDLTLLAGGDHTQEVPFRLEVEQHPGIEPRRLAEAFKRYGVGYVLYCSIPEIRFVDDLFKLPEMRRYFWPLQSIEDCHVYRLAPVNQPVSEKVSSAGR